MQATTPSSTQSLMRQKYSLQQQAELSVRFTAEQFQAIGTVVTKLGSRAQGLTEPQPKRNRTVIYSSDSEVEVVPETTGRPSDIGPAVLSLSNQCLVLSATRLSRRIYVLPGYMKQQILFDANLQQKCLRYAAENVKELI